MTTITTRSGRVIKKPERYTPVETVVDDFSESEYDDVESEISSSVSFESEDDTSESDADENGNLEGFVVEENSENNNNEGDIDGESEDSGSS